MAKQYGLLKRGAAASENVSRPSIFGEDSDSADDNPSSTKKRDVFGPGDSQKRQVKALQDRALAEDPTIFQYDEVYDDMANQKAVAKSARGTDDRKPKYIERLLKTAELRKIEHERRTERLVQKEREAEGEQFKDKEAFVTSAYRKKLEEMRAVDELEKREAYLESIGDVTKQRDLGGFYRHLYEQQLGTGDAPPATDIKDDAPDPVEPTEVATAKNPDRLKKEQRSYRKRKASCEDREDEEKTATDTKVHLASNLDADSDFSIDSSSDEDDSAATDKAAPATAAPSNSDDLPPVTIKQEPVDTTTDAAAPPVEHEFKVPEPKQELQVVKKEEEEPVKEEVLDPPKPKIDIWKKRTVGVAFDDALQRYYERKAARQSA